MLYIIKLVTKNNNILNVYSTNNIDQAIQKEFELININIEWKKKMASYSHPLTPEESLDAVALKDLKREIYVSNHMDKYYPFLFKNSEKDVCKNYLQML